MRQKKFVRSEWPSGCVTHNSEDENRAHTVIAALSDVLCAVCSALSPFHATVHTLIASCAVSAKQTKFLGVLILGLKSSGVGARMLVRCIDGASFSLAASTCPPHRGRSLRAAACAVHPNKDATTHVR